jgi:hypothetical protein
MKVRNVRPWRQESWTRIYEAALFERDPLRLWTRIWNAQLAIGERESQIRINPRRDSRERVLHYGRPMPCCRTCDASQSWTTR